MVEWRNLILLSGSILFFNVGNYMCAPAPQDVEENVDEGSGMETFTNHPKDIISKTCLSERTSPYTYFSTKTTYLHPNIGNMNTDIIQLPQCNLKSFWIALRHGFRNPGDDDIIQIQRRGEEIKEAILRNSHHNDQMCKDDLEIFRNWTFDVKVEDEKLLVPTGEKEQQGIAERFKARMPSLLGNELTSNIKIAHSSKKRTFQSAKAFMRGMFPDVENFTKDFEVSEDNDLLRSYKSCPKYVRQKENFKASGEKTADMLLFLKSDYMKDMTKNINKRLGFDSNSMLSIEDIMIIYSICKFQKGFEPEQVSIFCAAFDDEDLKVIEYYNDLEHYETRGPGKELNMKIGCRLIQDLQKMFDDESNTKIGKFLFTHATMIFLLLNILGATKDPFPMTYDLYKTGYGKRRNFRSSVLVPMSANVAFVMFDCQESTNDFDIKKKIVAYHNERPLWLERCSGYVCDWDTFKLLFKDEIACPFDKYCSFEDELPKEASDYNHEDHNEKNEIEEYDYEEEEEKEDSSEEDENEGDDSDSEEDDDDDEDDDDNDDDDESDEDDDD